MPREKTLFTTSDQMISAIDDAMSANMTIDRPLLKDVSDLKKQLKHCCQIGDIEKARRITNRAVAILRTGEAAKE
ncbi:MAG: hypothetical protein ACI9JL_004503 [Paracoccaceae bacterium]|jgi:hypothetical protein